MPREEELLQKIRQLEAANSELQDKLDMIYSIVAPEDENDEMVDGTADGAGEKDDVLVQISFEKKKKGVN